MLRCPSCQGTVPDVAARSCPKCGFDLTPLARLQELPDAHFNRAVEAAERGDWLGVLQSAAVASALAPRDDEALALLLLAQRELGGAEAVQRLLAGVEEGRKDAVMSLLALPSGSPLPAETEVSRREEVPAGEVNATGGRSLQLSMRWWAPVAVAVFCLGLAVGRLPVHRAAQVDRSANESLAARELVAGEPEAVADLVENEPEAVQDLAASELEGVQNPAAKERGVAREPEETDHIAPTRTVRVQVLPGDTYSGIALRFYGRLEDWPRIAALNPEHPDPRRLPSGIWIEVPVP